jgi:DNA-directed RNA polymerase specialized sigma24 family protein
MTMLTDAVLVDRVVAGFEGDFEELYKRHAGAAWRVAQAVTGNAHDAADAVAEACSKP